MSKTVDISPERIEELKSMASALYATIIGLTDTPFEFMAIISMMHIKLWLNCKAPGADAGVSIDQYKADWLLNVEANEAAFKKTIQ